jgi:HK97 gp10 family phage protein
MARRGRHTGPLGVGISMRQTASSGQIRANRREIRSMQQDIIHNVERLREYLEGIEKRRRKWLEYAAIPVIKEMKSKAPVDTGKVRDSIKILELPKSRSVFVGPQFEPGDNVLYYYMLEFGTKYINYKPQPFIRPAAIALPQSMLRVTLALKAYTKQFISQPAK